MLVYGIQSCLIDVDIYIMLGRNYTWVVAIHKIIIIAVSILGWIEKVNKINGVVVGWMSYVEKGMA